MNRERVGGQARYHWTLFAALVVFANLSTFGVSRQPISTDIHYSLYFAAQTADRFLPTGRATHSHVPATPSAESLSILEARAIHAYKAARRLTRSAMFKDPLRGWAR